VLDAAGRRVAERRAEQVPVALPELPRRARRYADAIVFVERIEPPTQREEDADTARFVARFQAGDRDAFGELYKRYFSRVFGYMRSAFRDTHEAEDAAQEVFTLVLKNLKRYERRGQPFRAWLFTIARNHAIRELRRLGRIEPMDPDEARMQADTAVTDAADVTALDWITDRDLNLFVERLPLPQRQVLVLGFLLDLPDDQVARVMGRSQVDVRSLRHRALRFLEERLRAIGRVPQGESTREPWTRRVKKAPVLRSRRHALDP
jgi:RNA polymerase sigma-70 factor (ECF subfamily)